MHRVDQKIINCVKIRGPESSLYLTPLTLATESAACRLGHFFYLSIAFLTSMSFLLWGMLFVKKDILPDAPTDPGLLVLMWHLSQGLLALKLKNWETFLEAGVSPNTGKRTARVKNFLPSPAPTFIQRKKVIDNWFKKSIDVTLCFFWTWNYAN